MPTRCRMGPAADRHPPLLLPRRRYGFIVMDGNGSLFGTLCGNNREILHKGAPGPRRGPAPSCPPRCWHRGSSLLRQLAACFVPDRGCKAPSPCLGAGRGRLPLRGTVGGTRARVFPSRGVACAPRPLQFLWTCPRSTAAVGSRRCALRACAWRSATTTCARWRSWRCRQGRRRGARGGLGEARGC